MIRVHNEAERAEIYITGPIVDDADGAMLNSWDLGDGYEWPADIRQQLDAARGKPLTVYINSDGGSVPAGVAIANMVQRHDAPTTSVVDGWCCSIATQIFFAAQRRQMPENAYLMLHKPTTVAAGNADELLKAAEFLDEIQSGLETTYQNAVREGVTAAEIREMVNAETWLTGENAAALFNIELTPAATVLNCYGRTQAKQPKEIVVKAAENDKPHIDEVINTAARIKAALAFTKGVMCK